LRYVGSGCGLPRLESDAKFAALVAAKLDWGFSGFGG
jgi:hypothetical protein